MFLIHCSKTYNIVSVQSLASFGADKMKRMYNMKKMVFVITAVLISVFFGGCQMEEGSQPQGSEGNESSSESIPAYTYIYNPYALPSIIEEELGDFISVYQAVVDAVESGNTTVAVESADAFENVKGVLEEYYPPFELVTSAEYDAAESAVKLSYRYGQRAHEQRLEQYRSALEGVMMLSLREGDHDTGKAMGIYLYATSSLFETGEDNLTAWDAIVNAKTDHNGYAKAYCIYLLQAGVDCVKVETKGADGTPHLIDLANLDGKYYYMDPYGEVTLSDGEGLGCFGWTRAQCVENGYQDYFKLISGGLREEPPAADDKRFSEMRLCSKWEFDETRENITMTIEGEPVEWGPVNTNN